MSKKGTKALASATVMSLVLTTALSAAPVKAAAGLVTRTSGDDRYATAAQVATSNWTTSDNVVLVSGEGYADAVSASALAKKLNAPILLTTAGSLSTEAANALTTLKAKNIYVVGGNASVSQAVKTQLRANYNLIELGGANRYETNVAVAEELVSLGVDPSNVMMVGGEGFSDALSVAPIAAAKGQILLLGMNDANYMSPVINFVQKHNSKVTIVGTENVISNAIYRAVNAVNRVDGGQDRFDTNLKVLAAFKDTVEMDHLYVANASGDGYADALVASSLAGKSASPVVLVDADSSTATTNAIAYIKANATATTDLNVIGGTGVVSDNTVAGINSSVTGTGTSTTTSGAITVAQPGKDTVSSVTATSGTTIQVKFAQQPADTTKMAFNVTRSGTPVTLTTTWDSTKTVATLTYSSNLPQDTYAVDVKDTGNDLGSTNVTITAQKIAKIQVVGTVLGVQSPTQTTTTGGAVNAVGGNGYALYKVLDQYGNDITNSGIAQGIQWTCGIGNVSGSNGVLTVTPFSGATNFLTQYTSATINGVDSSTGVTTSANLTVTQTTGTLSNVTLNKLYCSNNPNAIFAAGDTTDTFYIDFSATDLSGNDTKNYKLINAGLMQGGSGLMTSNPGACSVSLITDPNNSNNALIQVTPTASLNNVIADQPVTITMCTSNGKSSTINLTLKKAAVLANLTLIAPSTTVAAGDTNVTIPFTAVDQNGVALTKYSDIVGDINSPNVTVSSAGLPVTWVENPDETASLQISTVPSLPTGLNSQSYTIQAVVTSTGKHSSLNIVVQQGVTPNALTVDNTVALPNMEVGAVQNLDFGNVPAGQFGGLILKDQYGRAIDITDQGASISSPVTDNIGYLAADGKTMVIPAEPSSPSDLPNYFIYAKSSDTDVITINQAVAFGYQNIQFTTNPDKAEYLNANGGSATIQYEVWERYKDSNGNDVIKDTGIGTSQTYSVVKASDIDGYTIGTIGPIYDAASITSTSAAITVSPAAAQGGVGPANISDYECTAQVCGTLADGGKVALDTNDIIGVGVDDGTDFIATNVSKIGAQARVGAYAKATLDDIKTSATGTLSVTIHGKDGLVYTGTTTIKSQKDLPIAKFILPTLTLQYGVDYFGARTQIYRNNGQPKRMSVNGNIITMAAAEFNTNLVGKLLTKCSVDGDAQSLTDVNFAALDQYGQGDAPLTLMGTVKNTAGVTSNLSFSNNVLTNTSGNQVTNGDVVTITAVTSNGLISTVTINIVGN